MPDRDPDAGHSARLLRGLIWTGVLLAPLAAAIVLLGHSSGSVRFAVLLIAVSVVLIGASVLIRSDPVLQRMHVEDRLAEEVDALRADLRAEFARGGAPRSRPAESDFFRDEPMMPPAPGFAPAPVRSRPEPGMSTGGRVVAGSASVPGQRGAASVPMPPASQSGPPRASAAVRPVARYGRPDTLDGDFGASDGYDIANALPAGVYGGPTGVTYGRPSRGDYQDDGYDYGYGRRAEDEYDGYGLAGGYDGPGRSTGDPNYRAKRHRPSANDTDVGTFEDFDGYDGYGGYRGWSAEPQPDERYVHGYGPARGRR